MPSIFVQDYPAYRAEADELNRFWWLWLPLIALVILPIWATISFETYRQVFQNEIYGLLELCHALFPLIACLIAIRLLFKAKLRRDPLIAAALGLLVVGGFYLAGEELSWGQHHFGWGTPEYWSEINKQDETNIHNTSRWANHIPRAVLTVLIVLGGTLFPWIKKNKPQWTITRFDFLYPPLAITGLALIVLALEVLVQIGNNFDLTSVIEFHDGELQELFITAAVLIYAIFLLKRSRKVQ